jgi:hypothetical protein
MIASSKSDTACTANMFHLLLMPFLLHVSARSATISLADN